MNQVSNTRLNVNHKKYIIINAKIKDNCLTNGELLLQVKITLLLKAMLF